MTKLASRVALVTGGGSRIRTEICRTFTGEGASVSDVAANIIGPAINISGGSVMQ